MLQRIGAVDKAFEVLRKSQGDDTEKVERDEIRKIVHKIIIYDSGVIKFYLNQTLTMVEKNDSLMEYKLMEFEADYSSEAKTYNSVSRNFKVEVYIRI